MSGQVSASVSTTTDRMSDGITSTNEISNIRWHCISCFAKPPCTPSVSANFSFLRYDKSDSAKSEPQNASQSRYKPNRLSLRSVKFDIPFSSRLSGSCRLHSFESIQTLAYIFRRNLLVIYRQLLHRSTRRTLCFKFCKIPVICRKVSRFDVQRSDVIAEKFVFFAEMHTNMQFVNSFSLSFNFSN